MIVRVIPDDNPPREFTDVYEAVTLLLDYLSDAELRRLRALATAITEG